MYKKFLKFSFRSIGREGWDIRFVIIVRTEQHSAVQALGKENSVWAQSAIKRCFKPNFMIKIGKKCFNEFKDQKRQK